jgi:uncharacterized C2H2 Zn-finger protein
MPTPTTHCAACGAFVKAKSKRCRRCMHVAKAAGRLTQRAKRALAKLRRVSTEEHWKLPKLQRAMGRERKRLRLGRARWESLVRAVFGASGNDLVDPRQMFLFDLMETSCPETASPSPSLSRSA